MKSIKRIITRQAISYFGAFFALGMVISSLGPTLPYLAEQIQENLSNTGALFSARSLGYMLGSFFIGRAYDRIPGNRLLFALLLVMSLTLVMVPMSALLVVMAMIMFITGLCLGGIDVGGNTMVMWQYRQKAGPYLNGLFLFAGIGGLIVPLIVGILIENDIGVRWAYWLIAVLIIPIAVWLTYQPSPPPSTMEEQASAGGVSVPLVVLFGLIFFLYVGIETSYGGWIYSYTLSNEAARVSTASLMTSLFWSALTVGRLIAIPVASRLSPGNILQINLSGAMISMGVILVFPQELFVIAIGTAGVGLFLASSIPASYTLAERSMHISGRLTGLLWACGSLGAIVTPWFIGQLIEKVNPIALMITMFIYAGTALLIVGVISRVYKSQQV